MYANTVRLYSWTSPRRDRREQFWRDESQIRVQPACGLRQQALCLKGPLENSHFNSELRNSSIVTEIVLQNVELENAELENAENTKRRITKRRLQNVESYKR